MCRMLLALLAVAATATIAAADDETVADPGAPAAPADDAGRPADKGTFGIGLIFGEPTGICAKIYLQDDMAVQIAAGSAFIGGGLQVHGDFVLHPWILQDRSSFVMPVYLGPGARVIQYDGGRNGDDHYAVGLRAVVGLLFDFKAVPLDVFVEVAGVFELDFLESEGFGVTLNAGAGVRYYF